MDGGKIEVLVMCELLISQPREGLECNTLIGLDILNEGLWEDRKHMGQLGECQR